MHPNTSEIEKVGNAFISIGYVDYTPEQQSYLIHFLRAYGHVLVKETLNKVFKDKIETIEAMTILHEFANQYQSDSQIYAELKNEMDELILTLNGKEDNSIAL